MSIVVVIPSRGRAKAAAECVASIRDTARLVSTAVVVAVDADDPEWPGYTSALFTGPRPVGPEVTLMQLNADSTGNLTRATNTAAMRVAEDDPTAIIGVLNDDMRARTPGWDRVIADTLQTPGIAYGDDGFQHERLVTSPFISAEIVRSLGWYALPVLEHQFIDNVWHDLGTFAGCLTYLPSLTFEHLHPFAGKGEWDATYERGNSQPVIDRDREAYQLWQRTWMEADVTNVRHVLNVAAGRRVDYAYAGTRAE